LKLCASAPIHSPPIHPQNRLSTIQKSTFFDRGASRIFSDCPPYVGKLAALTIDVN
jgi:hypothetical protein